jgi:hypothetical protein
MLVAAARDSARSLQREIVWRLFRGHDGLPLAEGRGVSGPTRDSAAEGLGVDVPSAAPRSREPGCSRTRFHHTNHGGRPCAECGWPAVEGAVT